jgi:hypothetical protein
MARAQRKSDVTSESDVEVTGITVEQQNILDWQEFHALSVVSNVSEVDDEDDGPRENERDTEVELIEFLNRPDTDKSFAMADIMASMNLDADGLWAYLKSLTAQGYAIYIGPDGVLHFGMTAMAKLYDKMNAQTTVVNKVGRKAEVLEILQRGKHVSVDAIAAELTKRDTSRPVNGRNVSSQLSYLRNDGYKIATDSRGLKFLED